MVYDTIDKKKAFIVGEAPILYSKVYNTWSDNQIEAVFKKYHDKVVIQYAKKLNEES